MNSNQDIHLGSSAKRRLAILCAIVALLFITGFVLLMMSFMSDVIFTDIDFNIVKIEVTGPTSYEEYIGNIKFLVRFLLASAGIINIIMALVAALLLVPFNGSPKKDTNT